MLDLLTGDQIEKATEDAKDLIEVPLTKNDRSKLKLLLFALEQKVGRLNELRGVLKEILGVPKRKSVLSLDSDGREES